MGYRKVEIFYSVDSAAEGEAQVAALAKEIDTLGGNASETKQKADALAQSLRAQENAAAAIDAFKSLGSQTTTLATQLDKAEAALQKASAKQKEYASEVLAAGPPTQAQADKLVTLAAKEDAAQKAADRLRATLGDKRKALTEVTGALDRAGIDTNKLGDAEKNLEGGIAVTKRALNEQIGSLVRTKSELDGTAASASRTGGIFADFGKKLLGLAAGYLTLQSVKNGITAIIDAGSKLEGTKDQLSDVFGGVAEGDKALAGLRAIADQVPESLDQIADAGVRLKRVGLDPLDGTLQELIDANSKLGRSNEDLIPLVDKLADAYAKGKLEQKDVVALQKEGVPVLDLLSKATGKSAEELEKLAANGLLGRDAIRQLIAELGKNAVGAAAGDMDQFATATTKAKDKITEFLAKVADAGPLQFLKAQLKGGSDELDRAGESAKGLGTAITGVFAGIVVAANTVKAGFNVVTASLREFFANILDNVALVEDGLSKITFGDVSAGFQKAADETRLVAQGLRDDAKADLDDIADAGRSMGKAISDAADASVAPTQAAAAAQANLKDQTVATGAAATTTAAQIKQASDVQQAAAAAQLVSISSALAKADELGKQFVQLQADGKTAAEAVGILFQTADEKTPQGLIALEVALEDIAGKSAKSAQALRDGLAVELKKLTDDELVAFQQRASQALATVEDLSIKGSTLLREVLREELRRIGVDLQEVRTGVDDTSRKFIDAFAAIAQNAAATGEEIKIAFDKALDTADNRQELQLLKDSLTDVKVAGFDTAGAIKEIDARLRGLQGAGQNLREINQAFADLGITSRQALETAKQKAIEAFGVIRSDGTLAAGDVDRAFTAMADKVLQAAAAAGEYELANAEAMLKAQASTGDQVKALDDLIAKYGESGKAATGAGDAAAAAAKKAAEAEAEAAAAAAKAADEKRQAAEDDENFAARGVQIQLDNLDKLDTAGRKHADDLIAQLQRVQVTYAGIPFLLASSTDRILNELQRINTAAGRTTSAMQQLAGAAAGATQAANDATAAGQMVRRPGQPASPTPTTPLPTGRPAAPSDGGGSGGPVLEVKLDSTTILRLLITSENFRRVIVPELQRYLQLHQ